MECIIPGNNIKALHKSVQSLQRISDEVYIECRSTHIALIAMNMNKTVFARYTFQDVYFLSYEVVDGDTGQPSDVAPVTCKMHTKSLLKIFKQNMNKKVETCRMSLEKDACEINFTLRYRHDVTIVHRIKLIDQDYATIDHSADDAGNVVTATGHCWTQILSNFQLADVNLSLQFNKDKVTLWNYDISTDGVFKGIRSQLVLANHEFISYKIADETSLLMSLKPLRNAISFAEYFNVNISLHFKTGGSPMIITVPNATFNATFILATVNPEGSIASTSTTYLRTKKAPTNGNVADLTVHDQRLIESVNWDDEDMVVDRLVEAGSSPVLNKDSEDFVPGSPVLKVARIFQRCFDPTFHASMLDFGEVLAEDSDSGDT